MSVFLNIIIGLAPKKSSWEKVNEWAKLYIRCKKGQDDI